jgi:uncharacterized surface anchored protein
LEGKLESGGKYTLHESEAPAGYIVSDDISFNVSSDGSLDEIKMVDIPTSVSIVKSDQEGTPLSGAVLQVKTTDGKVVEEWVSDGKEHLIVGKLSVGTKYILHETQAPEGYDISDDIEFETNTDGKNISINMVDKKTIIPDSEKTHQEDKSSDEATTGNNEDTVKDDIQDTDENQAEESDDTNDNRKADSSPNNQNSTEPVQSESNKLVPDNGNKTSIPQSGDETDTLMIAILSVFLTITMTLLGLWRRQS